MKNQADEKPARSSSGVMNHKGRSQPLYTPRRPRPTRWRPSPTTRVLLGLFPGLRLMAVRKVGAGLPEAILGIVAASSVLFMVVRWPRFVTTLNQLRIDERWLLLYAAMALGSVVVFEALRLACDFAEKPKDPKIPRTIASFVLPALAAIVGIPPIVVLAPRALESLWFAGWVLFLGALPAAVWTTLKGSLKSPATQRNFRIAGLVTLATLAVVLATAGVASSKSRHQLASAADALGFEVLPDLLRP